MLLRAFYLWKCPFDIQLLELCGVHENAGLAAWERESFVLSWWSVVWVHYEQQQQKFLAVSYCYVSSSVCDSTACWSPQNPPCIYPVLDCLWITANKWWLLWHELLFLEKRENAPELIPGHYYLCFCVKSFIIWIHQMPESLSQESQRSETDLINQLITWLSLLYTQHMYFWLLLTVAWIICIAKDLNTEINLLQMLTCGWQSASFSDLRY